MRYLCCDERRRNAVAGRGDLNGIAFLEVVDASGSPLGPPLTTLVVHFINAAPLPAWSPAQVSIGGGAAIRGIGVVSAAMQGPIAGVLDAPALVIRTDRPGDFSVYQLTLGVAAGAPAVLDPILASIDFSFRPGCDTGFDIGLPQPCPPDTPPAPPIDYLSRDFNSLVGLMGDRMAVLGAPLPAGDAVDLGTTLVELMAYVGDRLGYRQDAVATEATLGNARQRISVRRHARLVDYSMHEGCNARAFVVATLKPGAAAALPRGTALITYVPALLGRTVLAPDSADLATALGQGALVFETLDDPPVALDARLDDMRFHSWGGEDCCLPAGATSATLVGALAGPGLLAPGRVVVLREVTVDPATGIPIRVDPDRSWPVRLTTVTAGSDPIGGQFLQPPMPGALEVTEIAWGVEDALPVAFCVSTTGDPDAGVPAGGLTSIAFGNVLLADHGRTLPDPEPLGTVPASTVEAIAAPEPVDTVTDADLADGCAGTALVAVPARFGPVLSQGPLTFAAPYAPASGGSAAALLATDPATARPAGLALASSDPGGGGTAWSLADPDLIGAQASPQFVVEIDNAGRGTLRFGDGTNGLRPPPGTGFSARYRVGNGAVGNIGAGTIACLVWGGDAVAAVTNPMPATGGTNGESLDAVRRRAPAAFRARQERAVTPADYAAQAMAYAGVQRAAATLRWTGSWHTHVVAVDRIGGQDVDPGFAAGLQAALDRVRLAGHDLEVVAPTDVGIELTLSVQVQPGHFRGAVRQALLARLNNRPGGLFDPEGLTFGQSLYLSPVLAAVQSTAGVATVDALAFRRFNRPDTDAAAAGVLAMAAREIARLDNDPNFPDHGVLSLQLAGGR